MMMARVPALIATLLAVCLLVTGASALPPVSNFTAENTVGPAPFTVHFFDHSTNAPTNWSWDLNGDGSQDSDSQNPICEYPVSGTYTIALTVSNADGNNTFERTDYITVTGDAIVPEETTVAPTNTTPPNPVALTGSFGATWIEWTWPAQTLGDGDMLIGLYDGAEVVNASANSTFVPTSYYIGDLNPGEYHTFKVAIVNATGAVTETDTLSMTTSQDMSFFLILLAILIAVALVGMVVPNRYIAVTLLMFSFLIATYLAIATIAANPSFSVIALMAAVVTAIAMVVLLYDIVKHHVSWENDDY